MLSQEKPKTKLYWVQRYWRLSKQLRAREQTPTLTRLTKNYLKECPVQYTRLRQLVEAYECQLSTVTAYIPTQSA